MKKQFGLDILAKRKRRPEKDIRVIGEYGVESNRWRRENRDPKVSAQGRSKGGSEGWRKRMP